MGQRLVEGLHQLVCAKSTTELLLIAGQDTPNAVSMKDRGRYRIPSTSILLAFESAARLGNFSQAGLELGTSQSAMSRYIARLETDLSARLFERSRTGVTLTEAGRRFHAAVVVGLAALHDGTEEVGALSGSGPPEVTIACPEEVSHLFVMQRYDALKAALGERVRVRILAYAETPASLPSEPCADVILTCDGEIAPSKHRVAIAREALAAFCSPAYAAAHAQVLNGPVAEWGGLTFLALTGPNAAGASWDRWFEVSGRPTAGPQYKIVESHAHALETAVAGRGIALGWRHLIGWHVEAGTLVMQAGGFVETGRCFHAALMAKGRQRPLARACLAFFGGAAKHRVGGWPEP